MSGGDNVMILGHAVMKTTPMALAGISLSRSLNAPPVVQGEDTVHQRILHDTTSLNVIPVDKSMMSRDGSLESFLTNLWEKQSDAEEADSSRGVKRTASEMSADSTESSMDAEPSTSSGGPSKLLQRNALLAKLLNAKSAPQETVINTQHTVSPATTPQTRLPKNVANKIIESSNSSAVNNSSDRHDDKPAICENLKEVGKKPNLWDNPLTNPNSPFPGNTKDKGLVDKGPMAGGTSALGQNLPPGVPSSQSGAQLVAALGAPSTGAIGGSAMVSSTSGDTSGVTSTSDTTGSDPLLSQVSDKSQSSVEGILSSV